jgi:anaerobic selenocysteine-containing dehydrogenase
MTPWKINRFNFSRHFLPRHSSDARVKPPAGRPRQPTRNVAMVEAGKRQRPWASGTNKDKSTVDSIDYMCVVQCPVEVEVRCEGPGKTKGKVTRSPAVPRHPPRCDLESP